MRGNSLLKSIQLEITEKLYSLPSLSFFTEIWMRNIACLLTWPSFLVSQQSTRSFTIPPTRLVHKLGANEKFTLLSCTCQINYHTKMFRALKRFVIIIIIIITISIALIS